MEAKICTRKINFLVKESKSFEWFLYFHLNLTFVQPFDIRRVNRTRCQFDYFNTKMLSHDVFTRNTNISQCVSAVWPNWEMQQQYRLAAKPNVFKVAIDKFRCVVNRVYKKITGDIYFFVFSFIPSSCSLLCDGSDYRKHVCFTLNLLLFHLFLLSIFPTYYTTILLPMQRNSRIFP